MSAVQQPALATAADIDRLLHDASRRPLLMGIVNCTPDSFHAGGRSMDVTAAVEHALRLVQEGADIVDVGGESTRPGAERVPAQEQIRRVVSVIQGIRARSGVPVSIDTTLASVAQASVQAGACLLNDVSAGLEDPELLPLAARLGVGVVLMHRRTPPPQDRYSDRHDRPPEYADVVADVTAFLTARVAAAERAGVPRARIVIDPGFGFGKNVEQNFRMLDRLSEFAAVGVPLLVGVSRKSFLGAAAGIADPVDRLPATLAAAARAIEGGAALLRVHDVAAHAQVRAVLRAARGC